VRRAERGVGKAIREGQENGTVRTRGQRADRIVNPICAQGPGDFVSESEWKVGA